jgi:hypothetical protein
LAGVKTQDNKPARECKVLIRVLGIPDHVDESSSMVVLIRFHRNLKVLGPAGTESLALFGRLGSSP